MRTLVTKANNYFIHKGISKTSDLLGRNVVSFVVVFQLAHAHPASNDAVATSNKAACGHFQDERSNVLLSEDLGLRIRH